MNKKLTLFSLLSAALTLPVAGAVAAPAPKFAPSTTVDCKSNDLLSFFDKIPGVEFAGFGGVNRRSLLKRKGAIVDNARKFILIPAAADPEDGTLRYVQISLFSSGKADSPLVGVSRIMWDDYTGTSNTVRFYYGFSGGNSKLSAAPDAFPYELGDGNYVDLPRYGTTIREMDRGGDRLMASYRWSASDFRFYQNN